MLCVICFQKCGCGGTRRLQAGRQDWTDLLGKKSFTYKQLILITSNFNDEIGRGGFGSVFLGYLQNGRPVAVKMHSKTSSQGDKEFLAEVRISVTPYLLLCPFELKQMLFLYITGTTFD